jgi:putative DNA primase/helicase
LRTDTIEAAQGRWKEILPALGVPIKVLNGRHQACPSCGGKDRFRFTDVRGHGDYYCSQCGAGKGLKLLSLLHGWDFKRAMTEVDAIIGNLPPPAPRHEWASSPLALRTLYQASRPITEGDPVARYLAGRGIDYTPVSPKALRYHPGLKHRGGGRHPGILAVYSNPEGKAATVHRTYLAADGRKAAVDPVRMFWPTPIPAGGAIRLAPVAETLGIAEGIETALAAWQRFGHPVWATTSEGMLQNWKPPPEVRRVIIYGDNDINWVGQHAAYTLARRLAHDAAKDKTDLTVEVRIPRDAGLDWADDGASDD